MSISGIRLPYFLVATRFLPRKNLLSLMAAYAQYKAAVEEPWQLVLVGKGEQEIKVQEVVQRLGLAEDVLMPGFVSYDVMPGLYGLAEALIHPATVEQWGLVINEACAAGTPLLVSNSVGAAEMVEDGENGYCFPPESVSAIAGTMIRFHNLDVETRKSMGSASLRIAKQYEPSAFGIGILDCLRYISAERDLGLILPDIR